MDDRDQPRRRPDDDDYPARPPRPRSKDLSVLGLIALFIGAVAVLLSAIPCLGFFTLPIPIVGVALAVVAIIIAAAGKREGLGVPVSGVVVNLLACVLPFVWPFLFVAIGMKGAQQAAQEAQQTAEAEQERAEAERREAEATNAAKTAGVVGLFAGPQGPLAGLAVLAEDQVPPEGRPVLVDLDKLLQDYDRNPDAADDKYRRKVLRITGTVERVGKDDDGTPLVVLKGTRRAGAECLFDDEDHPEPRVAKLSRGRPVTIQGRCDGSDGPGKPVYLSSCRLIK